MKFRLISLLMVTVLMACPLFANPEPGSLDYRIDQAKRSGSDFVAMGVFDGGVDLSESLQKDRFSAYAEATEVLAAGTIAPLDLTALKSLTASAPESLTFEVPYLKAGTGSLVLELVKVNIFSDDFQVTTAVPERNTDYDLGVHYRGIVRGTEGSMAAISFFRGEVMGLVAAKDLGTIVIGRLAGENRNADHVVYERADLQGLDGLSCFTGESAAKPFKPAGPARSGLDFIDAVKPNFTRPASANEKAAGDCVELYYETDYNIYQNKGSSSGVTSFVTGVHNQVAAIYSGENINTGISQIFVWNSSGDPYTSTNADGLLSQFQNYRTSFNGDLGQVLKLGGISGKAAGFSGICAGSTSQKLSASFINSSYSTVPTFSDTVFVISHEFGHTFGSRHTHACVWNGNNTAIDSCSGFTEGSCSLPGLPSGGGTIMSYCPNTSVGVNFNNGFGSQPGNVIRGDVASGSCLSATCGGGGGGGGGGGNCHSGSPGSANYCSASCPCDDGEGDCDSNSECSGNTTCVSNVGPNYGWASWVDVCEAPSNPNSCVGNCGGQAPGGCYCDSVCAGYGDCCSDKVAACG